MKYSKILILSLISILTLSGCGSRQTMPSLAAELAAAVVLVEVQ